MKRILKIILIIWAFTAHSVRSLNIRDSASGEVYKSNELVIIQVTENSFVHTSFLETDDFGNVPCNGLTVKDGEEAVVFDTPASDKGTEELIRWIKESLHCKINAIIPTHFHNDCLGGLKAFHDEGIPSYANFKTIALARKNNYEIPLNSFKDSLMIKVGEQYVSARFFGEGHTKDNIVAYFPAEHVMFGGCLIKETGAGKGYLGDANISEWPATINKVKKAYPHVKIIVPGHGKHGNTELLDYTIKLFTDK